MPNLFELAKFRVIACSSYRDSTVHRNFSVDVSKLICEEKREKSCRVSQKSERSLDQGLIAEETISSSTQTTMSSELNFLGMIIENLQSRDCDQWRF